MLSGRRVLYNQADDLAKPKAACRTRIEYKFFIQDASGNVKQWQPGNNLLLDVPNAANTVLVVTDDWEGERGLYNFPDFGMISTAVV